MELKEFIYLISKSFKALMEEEVRSTNWPSGEIAELWEFALANWSDSDPEIEIDEIAGGQRLSE